MLNEEFNRWEHLLAGMSEEQITAPQLPANLSIKDVIAHLRAWQQRSIARLEAALLDREPEFPRWPEELVPDEFFLALNFFRSDYERLLRPACRLLSLNLRGLGSSYCLAGGISAQHHPD